jgi:RNase P subunit RPR2
MRAKIVFQPGQTVPRTAVYTVRHTSHRQAHDAVLRKDEVFPECARCGNKVRFEIDEWKERKSERR